MDGVDVLIEDAQFLAHERPRAVDYGHATIDEAITLAEKVNAKSLVLFHHGPHRTDDALDQIRARLLQHTGSPASPTRAWSSTCPDPPTTPDPSNAQRRPLGETEPVRILAVSDLHYRLPHYDWLVRASSEADVVALCGDLADVVNPVPIDVQSVVLGKYLTALSNEALVLAVIRATTTSTAPAPTASRWPGGCGA